MAAEDAVDELDSSSSKRSSDTVLLVIAFLAICGMAAWFFLGGDTQIVEDAPPPAPAAEAAQEDVQAVLADETKNVEILSRARLAADAGMLVEPAESNALYYYSLYLEQAEPDAALQSEIDATLARAGEAVDAATERQDYTRAAFLAEQISNAGFAHPSIGRFETALSGFRAERTSAALAAAAAGDNTTAQAELDRIAALPRTQAGELLALRSEVRDALDAQRVAAAAAAEQAAAAQAQREREAQQTVADRADTGPAPQPAVAPAIPAEVQAVRDALAAGRLAGSRGAVALLDAVPANTDGRDALRDDVVAALEDGVRLAVNDNDPGASDRLFRLYDQLAADGDVKTELRARVDDVFIARATAETVSAATLRRIRAVAPVYPRQAQRRGITGRVKVEFTVGTDGKTSEIEVVESENDTTAFNSSAIRAVAGWEYQPRVVRGQTVAQRVYAYLDYNLD